MIEKAKIDGRDAVVAYLTGEMQPVEPDKATLIKIVFKDNNEVRWAVPAKETMRR